jgi:hypothetical protein
MTNTSALSEKKPPLTQAFKSLQKDYRTNNRLNKGLKGGFFPLNLLQMYFLFSFTETILHRVISLGSAFLL